MIGRGRRGAACDRDGCQLTARELRQCTVSDQTLGTCHWGVCTACPELRPEWGGGTCLGIDTQPVTRKKYSLLAPSCGIRI